MLMRREGTRGRRRASEAGRLEGVLGEDGEQRFGLGSKASRTASRILLRLPRVDEREAHQRSRRESLRAGVLGPGNRLAHPRHRKEIERLLDRAPVVVGDGTALARRPVICTGSCDSAARSRSRYRSMRARLAVSVIMPHMYEKSYVRSRLPREGLERLCRYLARPPLSHDRLAPLPDGRLALALRKPLRDGSTHLVFEPLDFLEKPTASAGRSAPRSRG